MKELELSVEEIKELMEAFSRGNLGGLKIRQGDFCFELEGRKVEQVLFPAGTESTATDGLPAVYSVGMSTEEELPSYSGQLVTSPIVGTFYAAPAPDKPPYVQVGSKVKKGDVLFIIESMKLMNEVTSDYDGTVAEILVENAEGVEYGQPVLRIE